MKLLFEKFLDIRLNLPDTQPDASLSWFSTFPSDWSPLSICFGYCFTVLPHWPSIKQFLTFQKGLFSKHSFENWSKTRISITLQIHKNWTKYFWLFHFCHLIQFSTTRLLVFSRKPLIKKTTIKDQQMFFSRTTSLWKLLGSSRKSFLISKDVMSYCSFEGSWCFWKVFSGGKKFSHFLNKFFISSVCKATGQSLDSHW